MRIIHAKSKEEMSKLAAEIFIDQITKKPDSVFGLATGGTPVGLYDELGKSGADFSKATTVNLDEYAGLSGDNVNSYRYFMNDNLFRKINIPIESTNVPNGKALDLNEECKRYSALLNKIGTRDIQLLGIGPNGHIGFCEPDDELFATCSVVDLTPSTIAANSRFYNDISEVPRQALSMGVKEIMDAKHIVLIAEGANKKDILKKAIYGKITTQVPASLLQLHPNVTVIEATGLDE
jgi:glucosamine-6-phosphate deaminase